MSDNINIDFTNVRHVMRVRNFAGRLMVAEKKPDMQAFITWAIKWIDGHFSEWKAKLPKGC